MKRKLLVCVISTSMVVFTTYSLYYKDFKYYDYKGMMAEDAENGEACNRLKNQLKIIQNNEDICQRMDSDATRLLVNVIVSARNHFLNRKAIRQTWGSRNKYGFWSFRFVFLIGLPPPNEQPIVSEGLSKEVELYRDIVIGNFVDSYANLTYKHLLSQRWVSSYCSLADAVVKSDDDVFLNVFKIVEFLNSRTFLSKNSVQIYCWVNRMSPPRRIKGKKWFVSELEYPFDVYPDYCNGAGFITTPNVMRKLLSVSGYFKILNIEDAFGTGILRSHPEVREDIVLQNIRNRYTFFSKDTLTNWKEELLFIILSGNTDGVDKSMFQLWEKIKVSNVASSD